MRVDFPGCQWCDSLRVFGGRPLDLGFSAPTANSRCECTRHNVELPNGLMTTKLLICLEYASKLTNDCARDWNYEPLREGMLYSYESGYNFKESFSRVCDISELPRLE